MNITIADGRENLYQWDTQRKIIIDEVCDKIEFANKSYGRATEVEIVKGEKSTTAIIPDYFLQVAQPLTVFAWVGTADNGATMFSQVFNIMPRNKPADYVFTPPDQETLGDIKQIAQDAKDAAESVRNDADAGKFDGADGYSPKASVKEVPEGAEITITDQTGTTKAIVKNGADGEQGETPFIYSDTEPQGEDRKPIWFTEGDVLEVDESVTEGSNNLVESQGIKKYADEGFAPIISETLSGAVVATDIVSSKPHKVWVQVESKNLFDITRTQNEENFSKNIASQGFWSLSVKVPKNTDITISRADDSKIGSCYFALSTINSRTGYWMVHPSVPTAQSVTIPANKNEGYVYLFFNNSMKLINELIQNIGYIQVEVSSKATPYTPYIPDVSVGKVETGKGNITEIIRNKVPTVSDGSLVSSGGASCEMITVDGEKTFVMVTSYVSLKYIFYYDDARKMISYEQFNSVDRVKTSTFPPNTKYIRFRSDGISDSYIFNIFELKEKYPIPSDGNLTVDSISPNMTITTDTAGLTLSATYNCDTKGYVDREISRHIAQTQALALSR